MYFSIRAIVLHAGETFRQIFSAQVASAVSRYLNRVTTQACAEGQAERCVVLLEGGGWRGAGILEK